MKNLSKLLVVFNAPLRVVQITQVHCKLKKKVAVVRLQSITYVFLFVSQPRLCQF